MKCIQVRFTELYEANGAFGNESISPGGVIFPKHLVLSYDLKTKTVVFPKKWRLAEVCGKIGEKRHTGLMFFFFGNYCMSSIPKDKVKKINSVKVDYNPDEFEPNKSLTVMTLRVVRWKKAKTDALIKKYQSANVIVAVRSRESRTVRSKAGGKERRYGQQLYELVIKQSVLDDFVNELFKTRLVIENRRFDVQISKPGVFPRQLANFNK